MESGICHAGFVAGPEACRQVIQRWDDLCSLKIWRIHLLSEDVLLLKYCLPETLQLALCSRSSNADRERDRERDPSLHFALFAFYSIPTQQVHTRTSTRLL